MPPAIGIAAGVIGTAVATSATVAAAITVIGAQILGLAIALAGSFITSALQRAQAKGRNSDVQRQERTRRFETRPLIRFAFGEYRQEGSVIFQYVAGDNYYIAILLSSSPCESVDRVWLNEGMELTFLADAENDVLDMAKGAGVNAPSEFAGGVRCWIGLGEQTGPPSDWLAEIPDVISATDQWLGATVALFRFTHGTNAQAAQRWTLGSPPPTKFEGKWTKLYDPRRDATSGVAGASGAHDPDDRTTWEWSPNAALAWLHVVRDARALGFDDEQIIIQLVADAADACGVNDLVSGDASLPDAMRFRCDGAIEIRERELSILDPILDAMAGQIDTTDGMIAPRPGVWVAPVTTLPEPVGDSFEVTGARDGGFDLVRSKYIGRHRAYESTQGEGWALRPGNRELPLDLALVREPEQAARIEKIIASKAEPHHICRGTWPSTEFAIRIGDRVNFALPGFGRLAGPFEVTEKEPVIDVGEDGVAVLYNFTLQTDLEASYAWTVGDYVEPDAITVPDQSPPSLEAPTNCQLATVFRPNIGEEGEDKAYLRVRFEPSSRADWYAIRITEAPIDEQQAGDGQQWVYEIDGLNRVEDGGTTFVEFLFDQGVAGRTYTVEIKAHSQALGASDALVCADYVLGTPAFEADAPILVESETVSSTYRHLIEAPVGESVRGVRLFAGSLSDRSDLQLVEKAFVSGGGQHWFEDTGQTGPRYYRAIAFDTHGQDGPPLEFAYPEPSGNRVTEDGTDRLEEDGVTTRILET